MNITPVQNKNQTSFGSVNIIQVAKKAFNNPNDLQDVSNVFIKASNKAAGEIPPGISTILTLFGLGKMFNKTLTILEHPGYINETNKLKALGNCSLSWLSQHTGIPIKEPLSKDFHSFYVYTKEQKDSLIKLFNVKELYKSTISLLEDKENAKKLGTPWLDDPLYTTAIVNKKYSQLFDKITEGEPVHEFVIDDLSQLPAVFKQIEY